MRLLFGFLLAFAVAAVVGLGTTWLALTRGTAFGSLEVGAWTAWPRTGTANIDPYAKAMMARSGELPIGAGDGIAFFARRTDDGRTLDGRCDVWMAGMTPPARFWTLTLYDMRGQLVPNSLHRYGFTSEEIVRTMKGDFTITLAARARAGNWLPTGGIERYQLVLRLYDTPVGVAMQPGRDIVLPALTRTACL